MRPWLESRDGMSDKRRVSLFVCDWAVNPNEISDETLSNLPANFNLVKVKCVGRVDPTVVFEAFIQGLDGVMILGCNPGDCHFITGNYYTENRAAMIKRILEILEVSPERLLVDWTSPVEGGRLTRLLRDFAEKVVELGPLGSEAGLELGELSQRLSASKGALTDDRLRWLVGRERELIEEGNVFGEKLPQEDFNSVMVESIGKEYLRNRILISLRARTLTIRDMVEVVDLPPREVLKNLIALERDGLVSVKEIDGKSPRYRRIGG
jgi:coenzyme F420-reducing hydrogenase delta subunit